jgi:hypothetical protein
LIEKSTNLLDWQPCDAVDLETISVEKTSDWGVEIITSRLVPEANYLRMRVVIEP